MFATTSVPSAVIDACGRFVAYNRAFADFLGYPLSEIAELDIGQITRPDDEAWTRNYLMRMYSGEIDHFETDKWYIRRDGLEVQARLVTTALRDDDGVIEYLVAALLPIDLETRGVLQPDLAQRLLADTTDSVTLVGADGIVRFSKGEMVRIAGYPLSYWRGRHISELLPSGEFARRLSEQPDFLSTPGAVFETELEVRASDGSPQHIAVRAINRTDDPVVDGFVLRLPRHHRRVAELAELARGARPRKQSPTPRHDCWRPSVMSCAIHSTPCADWPSSSHARSSRPEPPNWLPASCVSSQGWHMSPKICSTPRRLDAGRVVLHPVATDIQTLLDDVVGLSRAAAGEKPLTLSYRVARNVPDRIMVDTDRLRQVLSNLTGNAVKFTNAGSIQVIARTDGAGSIVFSIIDTGRGIPPEEHQSVLEPFTVGSTAGDAGGAGLGLSIVLRLVSAMDGSISLTSSVGEGSRFDVAIPLVLAPSSAAEPVMEPAMGLRVLVVEDDPVNQDLARSQLERLGVEAIVVDSGEEGFELLRNGEPVDVVLMDHHLPGWDGMETTRQIREHAGPASTIPVIGLSASASAAHHRQFIDAGMDDFVAKPASIGDLAAALSRVEDSTGGAGPPAEPSAEIEPPPAAGLVVDEQALDALEDELGSREVVRRLVDTFLSSLEARVVAIEAADATTRRAAHTLKSGARLLGADRLAHLCVVAEESGEAPGSVREVATETRRWFDEWLDAPSDGADA